MSGCPPTVSADIPWLAGLADAERIALEGAVGKRCDPQVDIACCFGVGKRSIGGDLLKTVEVGHSPGAGSGRPVTEQAEHASGQ